MFVQNKNDDTFIIELLPKETLLLEVLSDYLRESPAWVLAHLINGSFWMYCDMLLTPQQRKEYGLQSGKPCTHHSDTT
jgi:hypothetical protein